MNPPTTKLTAPSMHCAVLTPKCALHHEQVTSLTFTAKEGRMGVLSHHVPMTVSLRPCVVALQPVASEMLYYVVGPGMVDIDASGSTIITECCFATTAEQVLLLENAIAAWEDHLATIMQQHKTASHGQEGTLPNAPHHYTLQAFATHYLSAPQQAQERAALQRTLLAYHAALASAQPFLRKG